MGRRKHDNENKQEEISEEKVINNISTVDDKKEENDVKLQVGDKVKLLPDIDMDVVGARINKALRNYIYTVKVIRPDNYVVINCLTITFTVHINDIVKI